MIKNYFYLHKKIYIYIECENIILFSPIGIIKFKHPKNIDFIKKEQLLLSYNKQTEIVLFFREIFLLITKGTFTKFKIVGVGYRQMYANNVVVYKLRYSHLIYNVLPLDIITNKKQKRKTYHTLFSLNKNKLNNVLQMWLSYRIPNVYTKKGMFKKDQIVRSKKMVKKLL